MASGIKFLVFKGVGNEDPEHFWFVIRDVWEAQGVTDDNIKKMTLVSVVQDRTLTRYIKHSSDNLNAGIMVIQAAVTREFSRPKSEVQSIIGFKDITMLPSKTP